jgi:hypothetical protein
VGGQMGMARSAVWSPSELRKHRQYKINLPISEVNLHCNLDERPSINSRGSKSPFAPPPELRRSITRNVIGSHFIERRGYSKRVSMTW